MTHEKSNQRKRFWNSEKLIGISAMLISIGTLFVLVYQTRLIREQQYKSVYPHLMFTNIISSANEEFVFSIVNNGVGPAFITNVEVQQNEKLLTNSINGYIRNNEYLPDSISLHTTSMFNGMLFPEKQEVRLVEVKEESFEKGWLKLYEIIYNDSIDFTIEYESIYGEKWSVSRKNNIPVKID